MAVAFIGLGSNLGDREGNLAAALRKLAALPETRLIQTSRWIESRPAGGAPQGLFLNGVAQIETALTPLDLLQRLQAIETELGRPKERAALSPRTIDLDILSYEDLVLASPRLQLPHPRIQERAFVLGPLCEIAPGWVHPLLKKPAPELLERVSHAAG